MSKSSKKKSKGKAHGKPSKRSYKAPPSHKLNLASAKPTPDPAAASDPAPDTIADPVQETAPVLTEAQVDGLIGKEPEHLPSGLTVPEDAPDPAPAAENAPSEETLLVGHPGHEPLTAKDVETPPAIVAPERPAYDNPWDDGLPVGCLYAMAAAFVVAGSAILYAVHLYHLAHPK